MNKKGFTLIELLLVVALMAVLMLFAFPAVNRVLENSEKRSFLADARAIFNTAKDENLTQEELLNNSIFCYSNSAYDKKLEYIEKSGVYYKITFDNNYIVTFQVSSDKYSLNVSNAEGMLASDLKVEDIKKNGEIGYTEVTCIP